MLEIKVPEVGESIKEVQISRWLKQVGDFVEKDENVVELETEKASVEIAAPEAGVLEKIEFADGAFAKVGDVLAHLDPSKKPAAVAAGGKQSPGGEGDQLAAANGESEPALANWVMPAAQRMLDEYKITADVVTPSGPGGRLLKEDVLKYIESKNLKPAKEAAAGSEKPVVEKPAAAKPAAQLTAVKPAPSSQPVAAGADGNRREERKPMSMIRRTIASRLVEAQHTAALLTTFNEIDMKPVMDLRSKYKDKFLETHGVKLGFMSFFAKASVEALKRFPAINSEVDGNDVVYRNYYDIGIAIGGGKGLVVPVLRNVERMSFAEIEQRIGELGTLAQTNKLSPSDLEGGTFTISNGGVYGSLLSTPIVNPPQSGILGLHAIQERPIALSGQVVIRPMMYVALTYDHRIVDGREAVVFLKTIKEVLEEPARLFLEI